MTTPAGDLRGKTEACTCTGSEYIQKQRDVDVSLVVSSNTEPLFFFVCLPKVVSVNIHAHNADGFG